MLHTYPLQLPVSSNVPIRILRSPKIFSRLLSVISLGTSSSVFSSSFSFSLSCSLDAGPAMECHLSGESADEEEEKNIPSLNGGFWPSGGRGNLTSTTSGSCLCPGREVSKDSLARVRLTSWSKTRRRQMVLHDGSACRSRPEILCVQYVKHLSSTCGENTPGGS